MKKIYKGWSEEYRTTGIMVDEILRETQSAGLVTQVSAEWL